MPSINDHQAIHITVSHDERTNVGDWEFVEEGSLKGVTLIVSPTTGSATSLCTSSCREEDRWENLPTDALRKFPGLQVLDLNKSRYLTEFDVSMCPLPELRRLLLTRCDSLCRISPSIGSLQNLTEVREPSFLLTTTFVSVIFISLLYFVLLLVD